MRKLWIALALVVMSVTICLASDKVEAPDSCTRCGMNRTQFAHSRMVVTYQDGSSTGTCSINCAAIDMETTGKEVKSLQVADYNSKKLTDATHATWVIGGTKRGVMTAVAKWAFADKADAEAFTKANGGTLATFDEVMQAVKKEHANRAQHHKMGEHKGHDM